MYSGDEINVNCEVTIQRGNSTRLQEGIIRAHCGRGAQHEVRVQFVNSQGKPKGEPEWISAHDVNVTSRDDYKYRQPAQMSSTAKEYVD